MSISLSRECIEKNKQGERLSYFSLLWEGGGGVGFI